MSNEKRILIVDDEEEVLDGFELLLSADGIDGVVTCVDSRNVMSILAGTPSIAVILLDLIMPHISGQELLEMISDHNPSIPVIVITANDELETAVACMKSGAFDYLAKPVEKMRLLSSVKHALAHVELLRENRALKQRVLSHRLENPDAFSDIITRNAAMLGIFQYVEAIGGSSEPVLITGETGVGKELVARAVHDLSRPGGPFIAVNVAGLDEPAFSDTLFGHRKGAFTGAEHHRDGLVQKAAGGTLFLDEIGDLCAASQIKLLRLLQEKEYYAVGSDLPQKSSARILAASNLDFEGPGAPAFRRDLYYRLKTHHIHIPPLRERKEDIQILIEHFLAKSALKLNKSKPPYPRELIPLLECYLFPGNIRELEGLIFNAVSLQKTGTISLASIRTAVSGTRTPCNPGVSLGSGHAMFADVDILPTFKALKLHLVEEALRRSGGNQTIASRLMGISQPALSKWLCRNKPETPS